MLGHRYCTYLIAIFTTISFLIVDHPGRCHEPSPVPYRITIAPVVGPVYPVGTVLKYTCMPGRVIVGKNVNMCNESGHWWPHPPSCMRKTCIRMYADLVEVL